MKIRNGFVSNSSSSSFLIALEKLPSSADEVYKMLWGVKKDKTNDSAENTLNHQLSDLIYGGILSSRQLSTWEIPKIFHDCGVCDDTIDYSTDDCDVKIIKNTNKALDTFLENSAGTLFVLLHYEDNTEIGAMLEHNVPWEQADNVFRFSHH